MSAYFDLGLACGTYSLRLLSDLLDPIDAATEYVQLEYSSGGTLRHVTIPLCVPKQISIPVGGSTRVLEGSFNSEIAIKKGYTYFALGNPYIMNLIHQAAKPSVAILKHADNKGILMIYKIAVRDGRGRERNGKIFCF